MRVFTRDKSFYKTMIVLALPICLQQLITFSVGFTDNLMVGTLGDTAISGVYMGNQIQTVLQLVMGGISGAMGIISAQYWGKKDISSIKTIIAIACRIALIVGLVLTVIAVSIPTQLISLFTSDQDVITEGAGYLQIISCSYVFFCFSQILVAAMRSVEKAKVGMILSFITFLTNFTLNQIFIFGRLGLPAMGSRGAALGTLISRFLECVMIFIYVTKYDKKLAMKAKDFLRRNKNLTKDFFKYGLPVIGGDVVWAVNMLSQSAILGRFNAEAITAVSVATMLNNIAYIGITGLWSGIAIITSKTVGAGKYEKMKEYAVTTQVMFLIIGFLIGGFLFLIKDPFLSLYNISDGAAYMANQMMSVLCISIIGSTYQATSLGGLVKAGGDTSFVFKNDSIFVFCVVLPAGLIAMYLGAEPWVVFACLKCDQILKCFVAVVKINSFNWMKNLTRNNDK